MSGKLKSNQAMKVGKIMNDAFKRLDADRSGFLEKHELEDVLKKITRGLGKEQPTNQDIEFIMKQLDVNGDGKLSKDEFKQLIDVVMVIFEQENSPAKQAKAKPAEAIEAAPATQAAE